MANLYMAGYGGENQEPAAVQDPPAVDSCTGQRVTITTTAEAADGPTQVVVTDAHAQTVRPTDQREVAEAVVIAEAEAVAVAEAAVAEAEVELTMVTLRA